MRRNELNLGPHGRELAVIDREIGQAFGTLCRLECHLKAASDKYKEGIKAAKETLEKLNAEREGALIDAPDAQDVPSEESNE
jgi:hypothetical protein